MSQSNAPKTVMNQPRNTLGITISLAAIVGIAEGLFQIHSAAIAVTQMVSACPDVSRLGSTVKVYDVIVFGDQVPGVMTAIQVKRYGFALRAQ